MYIRGEQYTGKNNLRREDDKCFIKFSKTTEMKVKIEVAKTAVLVGDMSRKLQFL